VQILHKYPYDFPEFVNSNIGIFGVADWVYEIYKGVLRNASSMGMLIQKSYMNSATPYF